MWYADGANDKTNSATSVGTLQNEGKCDLWALSRAGPRGGWGRHLSVLLSIGALEAHHASFSIPRWALEPLHHSIAITDYMGARVFSHVLEPSNHLSLPFLPSLLPSPLPSFLLQGMQHQVGGWNPISGAQADACGRDHSSATSLWRLWSVQPTQPVKETRLSLSPSPSAHPGFGSLNFASPSTIC